MQFTIVIPCYNCSKFIINLYRSIIKSSVQPNEILLVDDKSTDSTLKILKKLSKIDKRIKILKNISNIGPGGARNKGAYSASNENIIFFDSDVVLKSNTLKLLCDNLKLYDAVVGIYSSLSISTGLFQDIKAKYYFDMLYKDGKNYSYSIFSASCAGIKKKIFKSVNGYDQWYGDNKIDYENEDLGYRLSKKYKIILSPEVQVYHNFPNTKKILTTLFYRTSHWIEFFFYIKKRFDEAGGTKAKGVKCYFSLLNILSLNLIFFLKISYLFLY